MKVKVITLDPSGARFQEFAASAEAAGIAYEIFPAVDARQMEEGDALAAQFGTRIPGLTKGMVGCSLSHLEVMKGIAEDADPWLVCEDDARFLPEFSLAAVDDALVHSNVVHLHVNRRNQSGGAGVFPVTYQTDLSTCAYAMTPEAARQVLMYCQQWAEKAAFHELGQADRPRYVMPDVIDRFHRKLAHSQGIRMTTIYPSPVAHGGVESTLTDTDFLVPPSLPRMLEFPERKARAEKAVADELAVALSEGLLVGGMRLSANEADRASFAHMMVLLREVEDLCADQAEREEFRNSMQRIVDIGGRPHDLSVTEVRALLVQYGQHYKALWDRNKMRSAAVKSASNDIELSAALAL